MTATAWRTGFTNAFICGVGVFVAWCVLVVGVIFATGSTLQAASSPAFTLLGFLVLLPFVGSWFYSRRLGGQVLLDCGSHPCRYLFLLVAASSLIQEVLGISSSAEVSLTSDVVLRFLFALFWLFLAFGRLQIRENGIWQYWGLLRWHKITSYRWTDDGTLVLSAKGFMAMPRGALPVPTEHEEAVNAFLLEHAPQARES